MEGFSLRAGVFFVELEAFFCAWGLCEGAVFLTGFALFARAVALEGAAFFFCAFGLAGFFEAFFFAGAGHNFGVALGLPGASGGLIKGICPVAQGEIYPRKTSNPGPLLYELALE